MTKTVDAESFLKRIENGELSYVLDVRTTPEYDNFRLKAETVHIPLDELDSGRMNAAMPDKNRVVYIVCRSGSRAQAAAQALRRNGYANVAVVEGGLIDCKSCGAETEGKSGAGRAICRFSFAAAASALVAGVLLGAHAHPAFYVIGAVMALGLTVRGFMGQCPMLVLIKRLLPRKTTSCSCG